MKRNTIQRQLTLDAVNALKNHPTADEVYDAIRIKYSDISKGTVYRNLKYLTESGLIGKISVPDAADRFDYLPQRHYHLRCTKCNQLTDLGVDYMTELDEKIMELTGLNLDSHEIFFNGICKNCKN